MTGERVLILGAAGRDFHCFNTCYRNDPATTVVAFTATQIPGIATRRYPASLAGPRYPDGIPIFPEDQLETLISEHGVQQVVFAYSDVSHLTVMHLASRALACGADFRLLGPERTMLRASTPVVSVCAVRTGCGKGMVVRHLTRLLRARGMRPVIVRHPMPYGDLEQQAVQRLALVEDCDRHQCTLEEREEYEQHIRQGAVVYAGVDYAAILAAAEREADIILWDGGNNDWSFFRPDLEIVVLDPHRAGDELCYHPGETNLRRAGVLILNKQDSAPASGVRTVMENIRMANPRASIVNARSAIHAEKPEVIRGQRVLVIEDGPTLTHGGMDHGAGVIAAQRFGAQEIVDPRPYARGSLIEVLKQYPNLHRALPAMGYSPAQLQDLADTVAATPCDAVIIATPVDLQRLIPLPAPACRVTYDYEDMESGRLETLLDQFLGRVP
ncbi:MAG: hypothetical protein RL434_897 [Pseudomonadota bacterium]|jgi:predicted GTPase